MWFLHDIVPAHFSIVVHIHADSTYSGRRFGRGGHIAWPPSYLHLDPLDFFFWDHLKLLVYQKPIDVLKDLTIIALAHITSTPGMLVVVYL